MFAQVRSPETLTGEELDQYLAAGWFRMGQTIFTTNFLNFKSEYYSAIWLRIMLAGLTTDNAFQKLSKRNAGFRIEFAKATITPAKEALYLSYKNNVSFQPSASLHSLLFGNSSQNIYNTHEVDLYDGNKLIAIGFFDVGKMSAAGITSFYDPNYKKYTLGKYLIYLKIDFCKKLGLQFFYPGYFVPGYRLFDYKLEIGKPFLQSLDLAGNQWNHIDKFSPSCIPLRVVQEKLKTLQTILEAVKIKSRIVKYEFFDVNLIPELQGVELFDFPIFLYIEAFSGDNLNVFVFNVSDGNYHWLECRSVWSSAAAKDQRDIYASDVLKSEQDLLTTSDVGVMAHAVQQKLTSNTRLAKPSYRSHGLS